MNYSDFSPQTNLENLNSTLDEFGIAVLANVITNEECNQFKKEIFKHLSKQHDIHTTEDYYAKFRPMNGGLVHYYGLTLIRPVLDLKTDERVIEPFKRIWNETDLTTSFDGMYIGPPPPPADNESKYLFNLNQLSFHTDQSSDKVVKCCVQAFINLEPTEHGDGCLSVLTNSHKYHAEFFQHFKLNTNGKDWFRLKKTHLDWFTNEKNCEFKMICAPKGSMVFWDSRTIHMGTLRRQMDSKWRFLVYVCYTPACLQTDQDKHLKQVAYVQNRLTSHWPYGSVRLFDRREDDLMFNKLENLTERHRKYFGV
jgi:ectoine hydroxylase-related dioxygenase (phytanoyl-CoA dioxygenase family)